MSRSGANYLLEGQATAPILESSKYTGPPALLAPTTGIFGEAQEVGLPLLIGRSVTIATVGVEITGSASAGGLIRLGMRSADATGYASTLTLDLGTIDATQAAGFYEITAGVVVPRGNLWLTYTNQGGAATRPTVRQTVATMPTGGAATGTGVTQQSAVAGYNLNAGASGALPTTVPAFTNSISRVPFLVVKVT